MPSSQILNPRYVIAQHGNAGQIDAETEFAYTNTGGTAAFGTISTSKTATVAAFPWVQSFSAPQQPAMTATIALDDVVVERHPKGYRDWYTITLGGLIGPLPYLVPRGAPDKWYVAASLQAYKDVEALIKRVAKDDSNPTLDLYCIYEGIYVQVIPIRGPSLTRSSSNRTMAQWEVTFRVLGTINQPKFTMLGVNEYTNLVTTPDAALAGAVAAHLSALQVIDGVRATVESAVGNIAMQINGMIDVANAYADEFQQCVETAVAIVHMPERLLLSIRNVARKMTASFEELVQGTAGFVTRRWGGGKDFITNGDAYPTWDETTSLMLALKDQQNATADQANAVEVSARLAAKQQDATIQKYTVRIGDTIEGIAAATLGDPSQWKTIADLNDLRYPYITPDGAANTAKPGRILKLPSTGTNLAQNNLPVPGDQDDAALYGRDVRIVNGDIALIDTGEGWDFDLVEGVDCAAQSLGIRLAIPAGEDPLHIDDGLPMDIGASNSTATSAMLSVTFQNMILRDDRYARVDGIGVSDEGDGWRIAGNALLTNGETVPAVGNGGNA